MLIDPTNLDSMNTNKFVMGHTTMYQGSGYGEYGGYQSMWMRGEWEDGESYIKLWELHKKHGGKNPPVIESHQRTLRLLEEAYE